MCSLAARALHELYPRRLRQVHKRASVVSAAGHSDTVGKVFVRFSGSVQKCTVGFSGERDTSVMASAVLQKSPAVTYLPTQLSGENNHEISHIPSFFHQNRRRHGACCISPGRAGASCHLVHVLRCHDERHLRCPQWHLYGIRQPVRPGWLGMPFLLQWLACHALWGLPLIFRLWEGIALHLALPAECTWHA